MKDSIRKRIENVKHGELPEGYSMDRAMLYPKEWGDTTPLNKVLYENKKRNEELKYGKEDVLSVSGEHGVVNQMQLLGRSYAGESVAPYHIVETGDLVYTKSPLKENPFGIIKQNRGKPGIVSTLYAVYHCDSLITGQYLENYFAIDSFLNNYLKPLVKRGAKNDMKVNNEEVLIGKIPIPSIEEQKKINDLIKRVDYIIELKQQKIEELQKIKRTSLAKMFPCGGANVPELRFPGFVTSWKKCKLEEVFVFLPNNTFSRNDMSNEPGVVKNIHYGDVLVRFDEYVDVSKETLPYIQSQQNIGEFQSSLLQNGDIIMADTAEDEAVGKCVEIARVQEFPIVSGLHTIPMRPKQKYASGYLGYYMNSAAYHNQLIPLMQGVKVTSISKSAIRNTNILYPADIVEQTEIGQYFIQLDNLINLYKMELAAEQRMKKGLMQLFLMGLVRVN